MSREARILGSSSAELSHYHVMSRCVDRQMAFDDVAKERFRQILAGQLAFSGVQCLTFCLMGNHFHFLLAVPSDRKSLSAMSDAELVRRCVHIYGKEELLAIEEELRRLRRSPLASDHAQRERFRERFFARMHDLAAFVGELKLRFTRWHNRRCDRDGTLWEGRYKSVLVEGSDNALRTMAAYIDLNPVRARLVKDPADYRWSGYGEAVAGVKSSRAALCALIEDLGFSQSDGPRPLSARWRQAQGVYRCLLYVEGRKRLEGPQKGKGGFTDEEIELVEEHEGRLGIPEMLRRRVRYFHDGTAIGSRGFLEEVFRKNRKSFGPRRKEGAKRMRGGEWGELMAMREVGPRSRPGASGLGN